ncbi:VanW family protein [Clostridium senegalense]|uniref:VanW family protein n=1 Tax=Clostridium senegalense TaxID=1465809 RepID=UPI001C109FBA|nr:VanW family protein [Clostridium senegalense]MBU5225824.1 VanW family protein [Clostridium senegalense]
MKNNKRNVYVGILGIIIFLLITFISYYIYVKSNTDKYESIIYPNVKIQGYNVGGLTKDDAKKLLNAKFETPLEKSGIIMDFKGEKITIPYKDIKANYDIDKVVDKAFNYGKDKNIYEKYKLIKKPQELNLSLSFTHDKNIVIDILNKLEQKLNKESVDAKIALTDGKFIITPHKNKEEIDKDKILMDIESLIISNRNLNTKYNIKVTEKTPNITTENLKDIDKLIASARTKISPGDDGRFKNIELCTNSNNGILIMNGSTYSFNELIGDTTAAKGYVPSKIIIDGKLEDGIGGGICQVSTTLHNAILNSGIIPIERKNHDMPVRYTNLGMDATIAYDYIDYKFSNTLGYPLYIQSYIENNEVVFNIYSNNSLKSRNYEFLQEVYWEKPIETEYIVDNTIAIGDMKIKNPGSIGYKVKTYRNVYENSKLIESKLLYDDYYKPVNKVILKHE